MATQLIGPSQKGKLQRIAFWMRLVGLSPAVFSESLQASFSTARQLALDLGPAPCAPLHMLLALSRSELGIAAQLLRELGFHGHHASEAIIACIQAERGATPPGTGLSLSRSFKVMLALAGQQAKRWRNYYVGTYHVLFVLSERDDLCRQLLQVHGVESSSLLTTLERLAGDGELVD